MFSLPFFGICATFWIPWQTVKSLRKNASQAGVRPGWTLRLVDGKVVTKIDQLQPPVELQFQRDSDLCCGGFFIKKKPWGVTKIRWFSYVRCGKRERKCKETNVVMFFWNRLGREWVGFSLFESEKTNPALNDESHFSKPSIKKSSSSFRFVGPYHFSGRFLSW